MEKLLHLLDQLADLDINLWFPLVVLQLYLFLEQFPQFKYRMLEVDIEQESKLILELELQLQVLELQILHLLA